MTSELFQSQDDSDDNDSQGLWRTSSRCLSPRRRTDWKVGVDLFWQLTNHLAGVSSSTRTRQSDCSRLSLTKVLSGAAWKLAMASSYSSESKFTPWRGWLLNWPWRRLKGFCSYWNLQLHHRAAVVLPHLGREAVQQKDCLWLPWRSRPGGVQCPSLYSFIALAKPFETMY